MSDEQLVQLNWRLAHPPLADAEGSRQVGLYAVAHLAAQHGIAVSLRRTADRGITAEVHLPAALITHDVGRAGPPRPAGTTPRSRAGQPAAGRTPVSDLPFSALRITSRPKPPVEPETGTRERSR